MVVTSARSAVIVRMPSAMVSPPFRWAHSHRAGPGGSLPNSPALAGCGGFHSRDVGVVYGGCQDVFAHGFLLLYACLRGSGRVIRILCRMLLHQQILVPSIAVTSAASTVIVRMSSAMVHPP